MWVLGTVTRPGWAGGGHHLRVMRLPALPAQRLLSLHCSGLHLYSCTSQAVPSQPSGSQEGDHPLGD